MLGTKVNSKLAENAAFSAGPSSWPGVFVLFPAIVVTPGINVNRRCTYIKRLYQTHERSQQILLNYEVIILSLSDKPSCSYKTSNKIPLRANKRA